MTYEHLASQGFENQFDSWQCTLANQMGLPADGLPPAILANPFYFCYFPAGDQLARKFLEAGVFTEPRPEATWNKIQSLARRHLFHYALYQLEHGNKQIATN